MATAPFTIDEATPGNSDPVANYPAAERTFRDVVESALAVEHDMKTAGSSARHKFGVGNTATRDGITNWVVGSIWFNTGTTPATLQRVVSVGPVVWEDTTIQVSAANVFTAAQTFQLATAGVNVKLETSDAGALGPELQFRHNTASPAANDVAARVLFDGKDSGANDQSYARLDVVVTDPTNASEDARVAVYTVKAGTMTEALRIEQGVYTPGATGGDKGTDTINATTVYQAGVAVVGDIDALATTDNPASSAYVAGSTGAGVNKKFRVGEVGGWVPLEEQTASGSSSLDFVLTSYLTDFEDFEFILSNIVPGTDNVDLWVRTSTDGGSTYDSGASNYGYHSVSDTAGGLSGSVSDGDTKIIINSTDTLGSSANESLFLRLMLFRPADGSKFVHMTYTGSMYSSLARHASLWGGATRRAAADVDAIRFLMSSGTISSGKIVLMGRRKVT